MVGGGDSVFRLNRNVLVTISAATGVYIIAFTAGLKER